jgi:hypothetical protein
MSEISENWSEAMSTAVLNEASCLLRELAGPRRADESMKAVLRRVCRPLKSWKPSRVRDIWYRDRRVKVRAEEIEQLRELTSQREQDRAAKDELAQLRTRISRLETLLAQTDEAFHGASLDALRAHRS